MLSYISPSRMATAFSCGEKYRMRYEEKIILSPSLPMIRGITLHKMHEINMIQKIISNKDMTLEVLNDVTRDSFYNTIKDGIFVSKDEIGSTDRLLNETLNKSIDLTSIYLTDIAPKIPEPLEVEKKFTVFLDDLEIPLHGRPDVKTKDGIRDLKVTSISMSEGQIETELQPSFYGLADSIETGNEKITFTIDNIVALKKPKSQCLSITIGKKQHDLVKRKIRAFLQMIKSGTFLPPAIFPAWVCSPKYCGYHGRCLFTK